MVSFSSFSSITKHSVVKYVQEFINRETWFDCNLFDKFLNFVVKISANVLFNNNNTASK